MVTAVGQRTSANNEPRSRTSSSQRDGAGEPGRRETIELRVCDRSPRACVRAAGATTTSSATAGVTLVSSRAAAGRIRSVRGDGDDAARADCDDAAADQQPVARRESPRRVVS